MIPAYRLGIFAVLLAVIASSCSGAGSPSILPLLDEPCSASGPGLTTQSTASQQGNHYLWSYSLVYIDATNPEEIDFEIIPIRQVSGHWNVLGWLEQGPCTDCFKLVGLTPSGSGTILADVEITHPFSMLNFTGFDVRGIAMFNASHTFPASGLTASDRSAGDGELVNADGYTTLYNSTTVGSGPDGLQGYIIGNLASVQAPNALLNGYKRHITDDSANTRNAFYAGDSIVATYEVDMPNGPFVFGYAVDANWAPPTSKPVTDPMTQFGPEANCPEPWKIEVSGPPIGASGSTELTIDVYDRQGKGSHSTPLVECPDLFTGVYTASHSMDGAGFSRWVVTVDNAKGAGIGEYKCLVGVVDSENDPTGAPWLDLTAYQVFALAVSVGPPEEGYARIWGGASMDRGAGVATDSAGNIYVAGYFDYYCEFKFPEGNDIYFLDPYEPDQSYLVKFSPSGAYLWSRAWGGSSDSDRAYAVAVDGSGKIYVAGRFEGNADFDPGDGVEMRTSVNIWDDVYLSKFDSSGNFLWVQTWGGTGDDWAYGVAVDNSGNAFVTGDFEESADFDPGIGVDTHYSNGDSDVFISKFDSSGNFQWARTWGGGGWETSADVTVDGSGSVYGAGHFSGTVDFNPGSGVDNHTSSGGSDAWFIKLDSSGGYVWAKTWGGSGGDTGRGIGTDGSTSVYVTGLFTGTVDLDPGGSSDEHSANGNQDVYVTRFDYSGNYQWARTWGGAKMDYGNDVDADSSGNVFITGLFRLSVDFDPGSGVDMHSAGWYDIYLSKFDSSGNFQWAHTWGDDSADEGWGVAVDGSGNASITGDFKGSIDFDPGSGEDWHTSVQDDDAFLIRLLPDGTW